MAEITVRINGDASGFDSAADGTRKQLREIETDARRAGAALKAASQQRDALGRFVSSGGGGGRSSGGRGGFGGFLGGIFGGSSSGSSSGSSGGFGANFGGGGGFGIGDVFGGNILASAFTGALGIAKTFFAESITKAKDLAGAQRFLAAAVDETGGSLLEATNQAADFGRQLGITRSEADRLFATSKLGLQGTGIDAEKFLRSAADLSAARGIDQSDLGTIITQIFNGADEGLGRLFAGKNPSTFFDEYARAAGRTADSLTDVERRQVLANAVIEAGGKHAGEAAKAMTGFAGALNRLGLIKDDVETRFGDAFARNKGVQAFLGGSSELLDAAFGGGGVEAVVSKLLTGFAQLGVKTLQTGGIIVKTFNWLKAGAESGALAVRGLFLTMEAGGARAFGSIKEQAAGVLEAIRDSAGPGGGLALFGLTGIGQSQIDALKSSARESFSAADGYDGAYGNLGEDIDKVLNSAAAANRGVDDFIETAKRAASTFDQFDPAKPFDKMGTAVENVRGKITQLQSALKTLAAQQLTAVNKLTDVGGAIPYRQYSTQPVTGFYGQQAGLETTSSYTREPDTERARRILDIADKYYDLGQFRAPTNQITSRDVDRRFPWLTSEANLSLESVDGPKGPDQSAAFREKQKERDQYLFDQYKSFDPNTLAQAGVLQTFLDSASRIQDDAGRDARTATDKNTDALTALNKVIAEAPLKDIATATATVHRAITGDGLPGGKPGLVDALSKQSVIVVDKVPGTTADFDGSGGGLKFPNSKFTEK